MLKSNDAINREKELANLLARVITIEEKIKKMEEFLELIEVMEEKE